MNIIMNEVGFGIDLHLFKTVYSDNIASYSFASSVNNVY